MDQSVIFLLAGILIFAAGVFGLICFSKKGHGRKMDVEKYRVKYLSIENHLKRDEPSSYHMAILNADKLVDEALRDRGFRGETMGERMKNAAQIFSDRNGIWTAHKLRNQIAHEVDVHISYEQARHALINFKRALKDLGAI